MIEFDTRREDGMTVASYVNIKRDIMYVFPVVARDSQAMADMLTMIVRAFGLAEDGTLNGEPVQGVFWEREDFREWLKEDGMEFMESYARLGEL